MRLPLAFDYSLTLSVCMRLSDGAKMLHLVTGLDGWRTVGIGLQTSARPRKLRHTIAAHFQRLEHTDEHLLIKHLPSPRMLF